MDHDGLTTDMLDVPVRTVDYHTAGEPFRIVPNRPWICRGAPWRSDGCSR
jgi:hypothetical protein